MAQLKVTLETSADEQEVGREELNEKAVQNTPLRRRVEERKRQGKAVEEEAVIYTYEQIDSMKLRELKEAAKKLRLSTDVEESLSYFNGEDKLLIDHWIHDFEDTSVLLGWNDLQKFIYGKRMLKGAARQFISFEREIKSWDSLKRSLIREFQVKVNSATIHKQLSKRRQQPGESSRLYIYSMQEIANQGNIEEDALIQYIADGLLGERRDKAVLYGSRTLTEFKNNIQIFDKLKETSHCNKSQQPSENKASINCVQSTTDRVAIRINGLLAYALLDTGSEVSIINSELYNKLGRPRLYETTRRLAGFGNAITKPIGRCEVNIDIEDGRYKTDVFVVSQSDMRYEVLLGRELLKELDVRINKGRVEIRRPDKRLSEEISEGSVKSSDYAEEISSEREKIVTQQLDEWLDEGIIQPSTSEYSSPVVVVPKKDGTYRVCIDYRKLNAKVIRDRFPMPLIEDCLDALTQGVVFSTIDLKNGFFHVKIEEDSRKFTSFVTPDGQFEFLRTPFGLCSSPASFLRFIDEVFGDLVRKKIVLTYMDDLIIPGIDYEDACRKLEITLTVAAQNGLIINWKKCKFLREEIEFLGHVVWNGSIRPSPTKIKAVQRFPEPKNRKQIQSFLGLTGYFRKFIKDYAKIARPLSDLLKTGIRFKLVTDCQAFQKTLKKRELAPKVARWALSLEEFDFEVEHRPGERMKHVDALSRYPVMCIEDTLLQNIRKKQEEEERLRVIRLVVEKEPYEDYILENNILMKRVNDKNVIVLPTSMQSNIIRKIHENGHFSTTTARETLEKLGIQQRTFGNPTRIITDKEPHSRQQSLKSIV
ncbi:uncharacterized protein LOC122519060 [Polistes fuscatus]|uniref:uncharacterized protein LOC122519060 n=1 Tax=Polistes fuscatus TaxID=30207 RepID=UPI001CA8FDE6|nr:uncharacterized protein LOC122519060 [Polistes fuscatus]